MNELEQLIAEIAAQREEVKKCYMMIDLRERQIDDLTNTIAELRLEVANAAIYTLQDLGATFDITLTTRGV